MLQFTEKDIWALSYLKEYEEKNIDSIREVHLKVLNVLVYIHEILAEEKVPLEEYEVLSEEILNKFFLHGISLNILSKSTKWRFDFFELEDINEIDLIDIPSIYTLLRAQFETLLMYHHIYVNAKSIDEKKLRYFAWIYTALLQRQNFPTVDEKSVAQKEKDKVEMDRIKEEIINLKSFNNLTEKQKKNLFNNGTAKLFKNWSTIVEESSLNKVFFNRLYYVLSTYAHTEGLSTIQLKSAKYFMFEKQNRDTVFSCLFNSVTLICTLIDNICNLYSSVNARFQKLDDEVKFRIYFYNKLANTN